MWRSRKVLVYKLYRPWTGVDNKEGIICSIDGVWSGHDDH